eukprot:2267800-Heterocapsa_arctica.AAC.1
MDLAYLIQDGVPTLFRYQHVLLDAFSCLPQLGPQLERSVQLDAMLAGGDVRLALPHPESFQPWVQVRCRVLSVPY